MTTDEGMTLPVDGDEGGDGAPFVFLEMAPDELYLRTDRAQTVEYSQRRPVCVPRFDPDGASILISNAGQTASDLVVLDYQVVLCSQSLHRADEGFTNPHSGEINSQPIDRYVTAAMVPPGETIEQDISWPAAGWARNIYLRVRVSTLWTPTVDPSLWDPVRDLCVTEAYLEVPDPVVASASELGPSQPAP